MALCVSVRELGKLHEEPCQAVRVEPEGERITVAELIRQVVGEQVRPHLASQQKGAVVLGYLTVAEIELLEETGKIAVDERLADSEGPGPVDVPRYQRHALNAFLRGAFAIFVDGRQLTAPDEEISVAEAEDVVFLRLVPFVGG